MAATLYSDILRQGTTKGYRYGDTEIRDWFRDKALQVMSKNTNINRLVEKKSAKANTVPGPTIGRMMMYMYDPKTKEDLPYYDRFPVIFPIEQYNDGWAGLNLHYLPPVYRARLMDALYDTINNQKYDHTTRLRISYELVKGASKMKYFAPSYKRYLHNHVKSQLIEIDPKEWDYVAFLPLSRFVKANQRRVWDDSIKKIQMSKR